MQAIRAMGVIARLFLLMNAQPSYALILQVEMYSGHGVLYVIACFLFKILTSPPCNNVLYNNYDYSGAYE